MKIRINDMIVVIRYIVILQNHLHNYIMLIARNYLDRGATSYDN